MKPGYTEIHIPKGVLADERIVGIVNFRGDIIIATEYRVLRMTEDQFSEIQFEQIESK